MSTGPHPNCSAAPEPNRWWLRLYVIDRSPRCVVAYRNITRICREHVNGKCKIEVVDLLEEPEMARKDQIIAVPTLVKLTPEPHKLIVGDFSKTELVLRGLGV